MYLDEGHFHVLVPISGTNHYRIFGFIPPDLLEKHDFTFEDARSEVERYSDTRVSEVFWFATYDSHHCVSEAFRRDRVFLLGDERLLASYEPERMWRRRHHRK